MKSLPAHLTGIFLSLYSADRSYNQSQWDAEFTAMAHVGIEFAGVRAALQGTSSATAGGCTLGTYEAYYPTKLTPTRCFQPAADTNALGYVLSAAAQHNIKVHIAPAMPHTPFAWPPSAKTQPNKTKAQYYSELTALQAAAFADIWAAFPDHRATIAGVYTSLEEWNGPTWMSDSNTAALATAYLEPLARRVHDNHSPALAVWASPYFVGNRTLHPTARSADDYAAFWGEVWRLAPSFGWVAVQDSVGWQGNTPAEAAAALAPLARAAAAAAAAPGRETNVTAPREAWSNVELFEGWPAPCEYPVQCGRHPAPIARVAAQLAAEHLPGVRGHIAWEWASCLSPHTNANTSRLYADYTAYLGLPPLLLA